MQRHQQASFSTSPKVHPTNMVYCKNENIFSGKLIIINQQKSKTFNHLPPNHKRDELDELDGSHIYCVPP